MDRTYLHEVVLDHVADDPVPATAFKRRTPRETERWRNAPQVSIAAASLLYKIEHGLSLSNKMNCCVKAG